MERAACTDERLDDLAEAMRSGFARVDQDIRDLRAEMREEFRSLRTALYGIGGGIIVALIGVIAAILAQGV
jgi:3-dehydroquinate synthetase